MEAFFHAAKQAMATVNDASTRAIQSSTEFKTRAPVLRPQRLSPTHVVADELRYAARSASTRGYRERGVLSARSACSTALAGPTLLQASTIRAKPTAML